MGACEKCFLTKSVAMPAKKLAQRLNSRGVEDQRIGGREKATEVGCG